MTSKHKHEEKEKHPEEALVPGEPEQPSEGAILSETPASDEENNCIEAEEALAELNDKYLRLYSEFDNYRRRTMRERIEMNKTASEEVITSLLPVIDDLERALKAFDSGGESSSALKEGVALIYNKVMNILAQKGLEPIDSLEKEFSTDFHEAVTNIPAPTPELKGKVVDQLERGYTLNGKVIRFAKVVVGS
jgi:molecular chaperone GrpE